MGLGPVNVGSKNAEEQTIEFTEALNRENIASGEKLSVIFGKIKKYFTDLVDLANPTTVVVAAAGSKRKIWANYKCTGTNDHTTINSAISTLTAGGKIVLLEGTYNCSGTINVNKPNVAIEGMGMGNTALNYTGSSYYFIRSQNTNFSIRHLSLTNGGGAGASCIYITGAAATHNVISNVEMDSFGYGINVTQRDTALYTLIENVYSHDSTQHGIHINSQRCIVRNCRCVDNAETGINVEGNYNKIHDNYIICGTGQLSDYTSSQHTIRIRSGGQYNDVSDNYILGKNYTNSGGNTNTFSNNRYTLEPYHDEVQYSTTPQRIGTWIDGSPVYREAFQHILTSNEKADKAYYPLKLSSQDSNKAFIVDHHVMLGASDIPSIIDDYYHPHLDTLSFVWHDADEDFGCIYGYVDYVIIG